MPDPSRDNLIQPDGWYTDPELDALRKAAAASPPQPCLEIGVARGLSARALCDAHPRVVLVDDLSLGISPDASLPGEKFIPMTAEEFAKVPGFEELGFLHIDADHTESGTLAILRLFGDRIVAGGAIAIHDFRSRTYPGVELGWKSWVQESKFEWVESKGAGVCHIFRRKDG